MEKAPFIGQLDRKIVIIQITNVRDSMSVNKPTETTVCEPYAKMDDVYGTEELEGKIFHLVNRKYTIRYRDIIANKGHEMLLIDNDQKFKIKHVKLIGRRSHLELLCERNE